MRYSGAGSWSGGGVYIESISSRVVCNHYIVMVCNNITCNVLSISFRESPSDRNEEPGSSSD